MAHDWDVPVLIVGMPRSGTTLAEQIISSHPDVTAGGELTFWPDHAPDFGVDRAGRIDPVWMRETQAAYQARLQSNLHNSAEDHRQIATELSIHRVAACSLSQGARHPLSP